MKGEMKKVVMTGPTGSIGIALIQQCIAQGIRVLAIVRPHSKRTDRIPCSPLVQVVACSLDTLCDLDEKALERAGVESFDYDVCYHFAWAATIGSGRNDMKLQTANIGYALDAVALAARLGCHTFVGAGSQAEYGRVEGILTARTPVFPENGYGMAKLCAGQMSRQRCSALGMRHIWVRILSVYGPYDGQASMVMSTIRKLAGGERACFTPGEQMWDYLYSADAAEAMLLVAERGIHGKVYVLGSGQVKPLKDYILLIRQAVEAQNGSAGELGLGDLPYSEKQVMYLCADTTLLEKQIGQIPHTDFKEGIRSILETGFI